MCSARERDGSVHGEASVGTCTGQIHVFHFYVAPTFAEIGAPTRTQKFGLAFFFVFCTCSLFTFSMFLFTSHHINGGRETVCLAHRGIGGPGRGGLENLTATRATPAR